MPAPPLRTEIADAYPNPSGAVARAGFGKLYDYVLSLPTTAGHRRRNINGDCAIAQAGTSFAAPAWGTWTLDGYMWEQLNDGVVTVSQAADAPADNEFQYSCRVTVTTADAALAAGQYALLTVLVEGYDVRDLIGRPVTLSFRVRSAKTGVHCVTFRNTATDRSYVAEYTVNAANTWEAKSVTIPAGLITAGTWNWTNGTGLRASFALAAGTSFHIAAGAWQVGSFLATANQVNCLDTIGNIFAITGLQLAPGSVDTPFEHRSFAAELALCQRYYERITFTFVGDARTAGADYSCVLKFSVEKRAVPTVTTTPGVYSNATLIASDVTAQFVGQRYRGTATGSFSISSETVTAAARLS
jgi:hypothetical protein